VPVRRRTIIVCESLSEWNHIIGLSRDTTGRPGGVRDWFSDITGRSGETTGCFGEITGALGEFTGRLGDVADRFGGFTGCFGDLTGSFGDITGAGEGYISADLRPITRTSCRSQRGMLSRAQIAPKHSAGEDAVATCVVTCAPPGYLFRRSFT